LSGIFFCESELSGARWYAALAAALLAGCTPSASTPPASEVNLAGFPPAFRDGYNDGCRSATGLRRRDDKRFADDRQYASGWRDGLDMCKRKKG
jgi:hypothetical protein